MAPLTPDRNTPHRAALGRSFTLPSKIAGSNAFPPTAEIGAAEGIETLYTTPNANVIKFSTAASRPSSASGSPRGGAQTSSGTLSWASSTDRTLAVGPLEIYHVPGSVSFLHSGALLHAILPRSQCWCVDGVSKFALRVFSDTYYRIELPGETSEDLERVEALKETLKKVLFYERTPCPFARTFSVELPDLPEPTSATRKSKRRHTGPAKKWKLARAYSWKPEDGSEPDRRGSEDSSTSEGNVSSDGEKNKASADQDQDGDLSDQSELADEVKELGISTPTRPSRLRTMRSVTAPPQLLGRSTPPSKVRISEAYNGTIRTQETVQTGVPNQLDPERLRTFQVIPIDMPPSPPDSSAGIDLIAELRPAKIEAFAPEVLAQTDEAKASQEHTTEGTEVAKDAHTPEVPPGEDLISVAVTHPEAAPEICVQQRLEGPQAVQRDLCARPAPIRGSEIGPKEVLSQMTSRPSFERPRSNPEDPFAAIQARILARRTIGGPTLALPPIRSLSSHSSTSSSTRSAVSCRSIASQHTHQQAFATALVRKACTVFLGPPAHLVAIMLRIAARFANGAFATSFATDFGGIEPSRYVPGSFRVEQVSEFEDLTDDELVEDDDDESEDDMEGSVRIEEDDFGVPVDSPIRIRGRREAMLRERRGWDLD